MLTLTLVLSIALLLGAVTVFLSWTAGRLDRLHIRVATAHASLERQLLSRSAATVRVAGMPGMDPASAVVLVAAAEEARTSTGTPEDPAQESRLSQVLRAVLDEAAVAELWRQADPVDRGALTELADACERVRMAHRFHDDLVHRTQQMRRRRLVRWLRLAGHAPWPRPYQIDDEPPAALLQLSAARPSPRP